jgi:hypothetical protein
MAWSALSQRCEHLLIRDWVEADAIAGNRGTELVDLPAMLLAFTTGRVIPQIDQAETGRPAAMRQAEDMLE